MKKYLVNNVYIKAASANDAVKKYKLTDTVNDANSFPNYIGTPSMSPNIMYQYIDYISDAIARKNKKLANFYIDKLVSVYYDYDKLEDDFKRFINDYSKAMNDVHTKMRAFQSQVYQMKDSVKDIPVGYEPKVEERRIINWRNLTKIQDLETLLKRYQNANESTKNELKNQIVARINEVKADYRSDLKAKTVTEAEVKRHYAKYDNIVTKINQALNENYSIKDSDVLSRLAYEFGQLGNYFDRANSAKSRQFLAKEDEKKYTEFYNCGLKVYSQLKSEVENMKKNEKNIDKKNYFKSIDNSTLNLLNDAADRLYWTSSDMRDQKGQVLCKKIRELIDQYKSLAYGW